MSTGIEKVVPIGIAETMTEYPIIQPISLLAAARMVRRRWCERAPWMMRRLVGAGSLPVGPRLG